MFKEVTAHGPFFIALMTIFKLQRDPLITELYTYKASYDSNL